MMKTSISRVINVVVLATHLAATAVTGVANSAYANTSVPGENNPAELAASDIRILLSRQLSEHTLLIASASSAMLEARTADAEAAFKALDSNSIDLSKAFGAVYGKAIESKFLALWREHIDSVESYVVAVAAKDKVKTATAQKELIDYSRELASFIADSNPNLPKEVITTLAAGLVKEHVVELKDLIDAQAANDQVQAFQMVRKAYAHMDMLAKVLADVITKQFPAKYLGAIDSPDVELRVTLNDLLAERTYLAGMTTDAVLGGRINEGDAGANALLLGNTIDFAAAIGSIYGKDAEAEFLPLAREHTNGVTSYAARLAVKDSAGASDSFDKLVASGKAVAMFFKSRTPNLDEVALSAVFKSHNEDLKRVADAQATHDASISFMTLRSAYANASAVADSLAASIIAQFPDKYASKSITPAKTAVPMPVSGGSFNTTSIVIPEEDGVRLSAPSTPSILDRALAAYWNRNIEAHHSATETPVRIQIPAIQLDAPVVAVGLTNAAGASGAKEWRVPNYRAVGWLNTSTLLGGLGNLVLSGHHNIQGRVFEHLKDVSVGDQITISGAHRSVTYVVTASEVLPEKNQPEFVRAENATLIAPTTDDRLTLVTCWPPDNNTHRLIVIARKLVDVSETVALTANPRPE